MSSLAISQPEQQQLPESAGVASAQEAKKRWSKDDILIAVRKVSKLTAQRYDKEALLAS